MKTRADLEQEVLHWINQERLRREELEKHRSAAEGMRKLCREYHRLARIHTLTAVAADCNLFNQLTRKAIEYGVKFGVSDDLIWAPNKDNPNPQEKRSSLIGRLEHLRGVAWEVIEELKGHKLPENLNDRHNTEISVPTPDEVQGS